MLSNISVAIIAGGKSKRFGSSKQEAEFKGKRLLDHAIELAHSLSDKIFIIGKPSVTDTELPVYQDLISGCGPICGIFTALHKSEHNYIAVLPVDMPLLSEHVYQFLYNYSTVDKPVVAKSHKGLEPLVSFWPVKLKNDFENLINKKEYKLHKILEKLNAEQVDLPELMPDYKKIWFININYQEDLSQLEILDKAGNIT